MILCFGTQVGYQGNKVFLLSKNLISALENPGEIDKKIIADLALNQITRIVMPAFPFISLLLDLVPKSNSELRRIHHLLHPGIQSVNAQISKKAGELSYTTFQEVLVLIIKAGRNCIILKRDIKDAF